jgi:hypothetical protein
MEPKCVVCARVVEQSKKPIKPAKLVICSAHCAKQYNGVALVKSINFGAN